MAKDAREHLRAAIAADLEQRQKRAQTNTASWNCTKRFIEALGIEPAFIRDSVAHFTSEQLECIAKHLNGESDKHGICSHHQEK